MYLSRLLFCTFFFRLLSPLRLSLSPPLSPFRSLRSAIETNIKGKRGREHKKSGDGLKKKIHLNSAILDNFVWCRWLHDEEQNLNRCTNYAFIYTYFFCEFANASQPLNAAPMCVCVRLRFFFSFRRVDFLIQSKITNKHTISIYV